MTDEKRFDFNDLDVFAKSGFPHDLLTPIRRADPVFWHNISGEPFWLITRHDDLIALSRNWSTFSSELTNGGITGLNEADRRRRIDALAENVFATMDPPEHDKYRNVVVKAMLPSAIKKVTDWVQKVSMQRIQTAIEKGTSDFVTDVAQWIPLEALAELAKIPNTDRQNVFRWVNAMLGPDDREYAPMPDDGPKGRKSLQRLCADIYEERKSSPDDDIISMMIEAQINGQPVSSQQAIAFLELLISAGSETTRTTMTHGVMALANNPEQFAAMRKDEALIPLAVEEMLRWTTPVHYFRRGATKDIELRGKAIKGGDSVILCYASANRDEDAFEDPFTFDITRKKNPHVAFGGNGPHNCLGANLARMEMRVFFTEFCRRVSNIELTGDPIFLRSNLMHGIKHLPLRLHPA